MGAILALFGSLFTSIVSGGATGILGVAVQRYFDLKNKSEDAKTMRLKFDHELAMKHADAAIMAQEWAARTKVAEIEGAAEVDVADAQAFAASFKEPARYSGPSVTPSQSWFFVALDFLRGCVRPVLTLYLCGVTTVVYFHAKALLEEQSMSSLEALELVKLIVGTVLYLTTTCVLWWFGTRNKQPAPKVQK